MVPKRAALQAAQPIALFLGRPIDFFARVSRPVVALLTAITSYSLRLLGFGAGVDEDRVTEEEIKQIIAHQSTLDREEQRRILQIRVKGQGGRSSQRQLG